MIECALVYGFMLLRRAKSVRSCSPRSISLATPAQALAPSPSPSPSKPPFPFPFPDRGSYVSPSRQSVRFQCRKYKLSTYIVPLLTLHWQPQNTHRTHTNRQNEKSTALKVWASERNAKTLATTATTWKTGWKIGRGSRVRWEIGVRNEKATSVEERRGSDAIWWILKWP